MKFLPCIICLLMSCLHPAEAAVIMTQPQRYYFQASDSPYYPLFPAHGYQVASAYYYGFEDSNERPRDLRWEFARFPSSGSPTYGQENFSVDGDDGTVDGFDMGRHGVSGTGIGDEPSLDFYFTTVQHQTYPLWFGIVITNPGGPADTTVPLVELLGSSGQTLGQFSLYSVRQEMFNDNLPGNDANIYRVRNDRLIVFHSDEPIARVKFYNGLTFDHVQFGYDRVYVPEPGGAALAGLTVLALTGRRRRR